MVDPCVFLVLLPVALWLCYCCSVLILLVFPSAVEGTRGSGGNGYQINNEGGDQDLVCKALSTLRNASLLSIDRLYLYNGVQCGLFTALSLLLKRGR